MASYLQRVVSHEMHSLDVLLPAAQGRVRNNAADVPKRTSFARRRAFARGQNAEKFVATQGMMQDPQTRTGVCMG